MQFSGALTALVTPFRNNALDEEAYRAFIEHQISEGIHGLVPCGTTGESATLTHEEHERVIEICIDQVKGRVPVLAGAGSNNTMEAIRLTKFAQKAGADGALLITPYYNKPTQEGLYQHFKAIAQAVDMPLVPYNVPGRTGCNLLPATLARMARDFPNIVGVKEATGDLVQGSRVLESCPENFSVLSGDDFTALPLMALGGNVSSPLPPILCPAAWQPCAMPSTRATSRKQRVSTMRSFPCTMPCSLRAILFRPRQRLRSWAAWKRKSACPSAPWPKAPSKSSLKCCASRTSSSLAAADMTKPPNLSGSGAFAFSLQQKSDIRRGLLGQLYRLPHHQPHRPRLHAWRKPMMCRTRSQPYRLTGHRQ